MFEVGMAEILEKKSIIIDGIEAIYYETIDWAVGAKHHFKNAPMGFMYISKDIGKTISIDYDFDSDASYIAANFRNFLTLCDENNNIFDMNAFIERYGNAIGKCYCYKDFHLEPITDEKILQCIKESQNIFGKENDTFKKSDAFERLVGNMGDSIDENVEKVLTYIMKKRNEPIEPDEIIDPLL